jgi:hypothetical protein
VSATIRSRTYDRAAIRWFLVGLVVAGLAIDAYVHFDLAGNYSAIKTSTLSQADLFRAEGAVSIVAAVALLVRPRRYTAAIAFVIAASALIVLLVYRYNNIDAFGPIPAMYEPVWFREKVVAAIAEGVATVASGALLLIPSRAARS